MLERAHERLVGVVELALDDAPVVDAQHVARLHLHPINLRVADRARDLDGVDALRRLLHRLDVGLHVRLEVER